MITDCVNVLVRVLFAFGEYFRSLISKNPEFKDDRKKPQEIWKRKDFSAVNKFQVKNKLLPIRTHTFIFLNKFSISLVISKNKNKYSRCTMIFIQSSEFTVRLEIKKNNHM